MTTKYSFLWKSSRFALSTSRAAHCLGSPWLVDGRSCRFELKPEALWGCERAYQVHDVCADALKQRVENDEPVIRER